MVFIPAWQPPTAHASAHRETRPAAVVPHRRQHHGAAGGHPRGSRRREEPRSISR
jgi:hypothetical protein